MSLPRIRLERCTKESDDIWLLDSEQTRYLVKALRSYEGAVVEGLLPAGAGKRLRMKLYRRGEDHLLRTLDETAAESDRLKVTLLIGMLKADQFEAVLHAAGELGIREIRPVLCARSVPRLEGASLDGRLARWRRIIDEGTKVSGAVFAPELHEPVPFRSTMWEALPKIRLAAMLSPERTRPLCDVLPEEGEVVFAVGPEGDWTDEEAEWILSAGFTPVSLGRRVLRASTAAIVGCGVLLACAA